MKTETDEGWQILESIMNPKIQLNPCLDKLIAIIASQRAARGQDETVGRSIPMIRIVARIPDFIQHPQLYLSEVKWRYPRLKADCQIVRTSLAKMAELISSPEADLSTIKTYAHCQTAYGLALSMATILNGILPAFDPRDTSLVEDSASFVDEIVILTEQASRFRPLAASYIPVCLATGWAATDDPSRKAEIESHLAEYQTDLADARWLEGAMWLKAQYGGWRWTSMMPSSTTALIHEPRVAAQAESSCDVQ